MNKYNLFDKELRELYISGPKSVAIIFFVICVVFAVLSALSKFIFTNFIDFYFLLVMTIIFGGVSTIMLIRHIYCNRIYGNRISIANGIIIVYDYKDNKIREINVLATNRTYLNAKFHIALTVYTKKCLVIYNNTSDIDLPAEFEDMSYCNDCLIIENAQTIDVVEKELIGLVGMDYKKFKTINKKILTEYGFIYFNKKFYLLLPNIVIRVQYLRNPWGRGLMIVYDVLIKCLVKGYNMESLVEIAEAFEDISEIPVQMPLLENIDVKTSTGKIDRFFYAPEIDENFWENEFRKTIHNIFDPFKENDLARMKSMVFCKGQGRFIVNDAVENYLLNYCKN